ncbi:MAG: hypothetical protein HOQ11_16355 [Gemmatimonadaceae bacterium]|nr:hypothetical protein [Gemmatimonadaceae bacterium]NUQ94877.1 hypothetical protein [Gemmatimonadaceae bacterium]NUR21183.1 hypothetical protein [Gemmatimonadaceae bacterium]NUS98974.1 hypothetical protein [Gemmatimonadaceae bacterium]
MLIRLPLALLAAFLLARYVPTARAAGARFARWLESPRWAPLAVALLTAVMLTAAWGSWHAIPVVHDEASYLFQAKLFASGHWTAPSPPFPQFFEQFHVFVVPRYASKYPPGHALLMVPGIWLGLPGLMPVLIAAAAAALVFSVVRRLTNGSIALLTWLLWITAPYELWVFGSYFSQSTSLLTWMLGWYALLRWREGGERWLLLVAGCVAWLAFTRPLTAVAYALPVGTYVLWRVSRTRQLASLGRAMALGAAMLLVIPLWSRETIGTERETPYALYSRMYFPWDAPGFGLDSTPPQRALPADMQLITLVNRESHLEYVPAALPRVLWKRAARVAKDVWGAPRTILALFAIIGLGAMSAEIGFGLATLGVLLLAYLWFNHAANWSIYYAEGHPVLMLITALGLWRVLQWCVPREERAEATRGDAPARAPRPMAAAMVLVVAIFMADVARHMVANAHEASEMRESYQLAFQQAIAKIPDPKSIVFVRYAPDHNPHLSLIYNEPDLAEARHWIVYDRGGENARLLQLAPGRVGYLFDEPRHELRPWVAARDSVLPMVADPEKTAAR